MKEQGPDWFLFIIIIIIIIIPFILPMPTRPERCVVETFADLSSSGVTILQFTDLSSSGVTVLQFTDLLITRAFISYNFLYVVGLLRK
jgi:hypothetical protein